MSTNVIFLSEKDAHQMLTTRCFYSRKKRKKLQTACKKPTNEEVLSSKELLSSIDVLVCGVCLKKRTQLQWQITLLTGLPANVVACGHTVVVCPSVIMLNFTVKVAHSNGVDFLNYYFMSG